MLPFLLACGGDPLPPDVLLVTLDTTRADALGAYGNARAHTPTLDALAAGGLRVAEASTTAPLTLPAHASLMTGLYPDLHGVRDNNGFVVPGSLTTLAEAFRAGGYQTGAAVAAAVLDDALGIGQGFDSYQDGFDPTSAELSLEVPRWDGDIVRGRAQAWLEGLDGARPFFGWVHLYDAHLPLAPEERWLAETGGDPYLAAIAFADEQLRILLRQIEVLERGRPLVVAVTADHGEDRGDHGEATHGVFLYRSTLRVPLILWGEGVPAGEVLAGPASIVDLAPTLLDLAGLPPLERGDGTSLLAQRRGQARATPVYAESYLPRLQFGYAELRTLQDERWRYVLAPRPELYDWAADPGERASQPAAPEAAALDRRLAAFLAGRPSPAAAAASDGMLAALESLGYVAPLALVQEETSYEDLPDPKDDPLLAQRFHLAVADARRRPPAEGAALLEAYLAAHPQVGAARPFLARAYGLTGRFDQAREALAPLLRARPQDPSLLTQMAILSLEAGDMERAAAEADALTAAHPQAARAWGVAGEARRRRGDCPAALDVAARGLAHHPRASLLLVLRGSCQLELGQPEAAAEALSQALAIDPRNPDVRFLLGTALLRTGRPAEARSLLEAQLAYTPDHPLLYQALADALARTGAAQAEIDAALARASREEDR